MPFQTIEDVLVLDSKTILVANDNNYPFSIGRPPNIDNNEIVVIELDQPLALDNRLGTAANFAETSQLVSGTPGNDTAIANDPNSNVILDGINDTVFTGAGNDEVDTTFAINSPLSRGNRINTGSGADEIVVNNGDRANGGSGNDIFDASEVSGYRLSGGKGNDIFNLGMSGRAIGGDGDDKFYVGEYGDNLLAGGAGADQFWLLTDDPALIEIPNTVTDFTQGVDVIGIMSQGTGVGFANLSFTGNSIALNGDTFATLTGVNTSTLTAADFVFNVN
jgi:glycerophosphoryl diester phosphodiesterase